MKVEDLLDKLEGVKRVPGGWVARCPVPEHNDRTPSLSVKAGEVSALLFCHGGCHTTEVLKALGLHYSDLFYEPKKEVMPESTYVYTSETGTALYEVVRFPGKKFKQRRAGSKEWGIGDVRRVLYNLPALIHAKEIGRKTVYVVEGEKDVEALREAGAVATTNMGGAGNWRPEYNPYFKDCKVIIVQDKDEPGRKHAQQVAKSLFGVAHNITIVEPRSGKDAWDHLEAGYTPEQFALAGYKRSDQDRVISAASMAENFLLRLQQTKEQEVFYGNPWGVDDIEFYPGGFYPIGGRTGLGKSNLALDLFRFLCEQGVASVYITNEMTEMELTSRLICHSGGFKGARELRKPSSLSRDQLEIAKWEASRIAQWPCSIVFDETADHKAVSEYVSQTRAKFVIFDHLHLMESAVSGDHSQLQAEIKGLKSLAMDHDIPVVALSQLRRPDRMNPFATPTLHDFAGSQAIENAASIAMILHSPGFNAYQLTVVKNRDGLEPSVPLTFNLKNLRFTKGGETSW